MNTKELKFLRRAQLLELMLEQQNVIEEQQARINELEKELANRHLKMEQVGSIAEASLSLTRIFEEAQAAADLYLENVRRIVEEKEENGI
ncbi:DNA repair protein [Streptococcus gallinaceus]|uniref:DNA repair ATPase n=1 Tax=Streptococcus gallinaceus TaxID=165758 RepID=A0ABV2JKG7_9STRE|nr:DNA repair protein [Streptococcus gallinaceus]MCP1639274.1 hypothetical protein [Streptococcus gallinaceus]MCP1770082.1 hypothetical protein [Streptococcus gallinaceus]